MKKITALFLSILMLISLFSCSAYRNDYNATMLVKSEGRDGCEAEFLTLNGTLVLNSTVRSSETDGTIHYDAELAEGELSVYYDIDGTKELLFTIKGGQELDGTGGTVNIGDKVTFIIETNGTAKNGEIEIDFD